MVSRRLQFMKAQLGPKAGSDEAVGRQLVIVSLSGRPAWDWQSAAELAEAQAARLGVAL